MAEHIYITGSSTLDTRIQNTVNTDTRIQGTVEVDLNAWQIAVGIALGFVFCFLLVGLYAFAYQEKLDGLNQEKQQEYAPQRISIQGVDCVVISKTAVSCDWNNAQPYTQKQGEKE